MGGLNPKDFQQRVGRVDSLVRSLERMASPDAQATARQMVQALLELHGAALERLLDVVYESGPSGQALIDRLGDDEVVGSLLLLHGLHPLSLEARVGRALEKVRPYMRSHGGGVELLDITPEGVVKLRLQGSCDGCPSSRVTLKYAVEEAIFAAAPDVTRVEAESTQAPPAAAPWASSR
jgi:Fe-S cluster biogenesis protein NfuA